MRFFVFLFLLVFADGLSAVYAEPSAPAVPQVLSSQVQMEKRLESMQYVFYFSKMAYTTQKLRAIKLNLRKARAHLENILEEEGVDGNEAAALDDQIKNNRMILAAQEINRSIDQALGSRNVPEARRHAKAAMEQSMAIAYPQTHSMVEVDLDYDNILRPY